MQQQRDRFALLPKTAMCACRVGKYEVAPLIALLNLIQIEFDSKPEMYKVLLAILCDYDPSLLGNKERTCRYIRLLVTDKILANCVLASLPKGATERSCPPTVHQNILYPLKKRIKYRYFFNPKRSSLQRSHRLLRSNKQSTTSHSKSTDLDNEVGQVEPPDECTDYVTTQETTTSECSAAADGLLALSSSCGESPVPKKECVIVETSSKAVTQTDASIVCTSVSSVCEPASPWTSQGHNLSEGQNIGKGQTGIQDQSSSPWTPIKQVLGIGQGQTTGQGHNMTQFHHAGLMSPLLMGIPYVYPQYAYAQPIPSFVDYPNNYGAGSVMHPLASLQLLQGVHQHQLAKTSMTASHTYSYSDSLLDLSSSGKSCSTSVPLTKPIEKRAVSNIGVAKPLKRSSSTSSVTKDTRTAPMSKKVKVRTSNEGSRALEKTSSLVTGGSAKPILALQELTSNVDRIIGTDPPQANKHGLLSPFVSATNNQASENKNPTQKILANPVEGQMCLPTDMNNSQNSAPINTVIPIDSTQLKQMDENMNGTVISQTESQLKDSNVQLPGKDVDSSSSSRLVKSFPYSQHLLLPNGSCPRIDFPLLQEYYDDVKTNKRSSREKDNTPTLSIDQDCNPEFSFSQSYPLNLSKTNTATKATKRSASVETKTHGSNKNLKTKQVKIKLDKQSGGHFLAELLKLKSANSSSAAVLTSSTSGATSVYRTPVTVAPHRMLLSQGSSTTARQLLLTTMSGRGQSKNIPTNETTRKVNNLIPKVKHTVSLSDTCINSGSCNITKSVRSKSQSDLGQGQMEGCSSQPTEGQSNNIHMMLPVNIVELHGNKGNKGQPTAPQGTGVSQQKSYIVQTFPIKTTADVETNRIKISDNTLHEAIKERLQQMESQWGLQQRKRASSDSSMMSLRVGDEQQIVPGQGLSFPTSSTPMFRQPPPTVVPFTITQPVTNLSKNYNSVNTNHSNNQSSDMLVKSTESMASGSNRSENIETVNSMFTAGLRPSNNGNLDNTAVQDDVFECSDPHSRASSISLSPSLLGLLPDKLYEDDSDDVFMCT